MTRLNDPKITAFFSYCSQHGHGETLPPTGDSCWQRIPANLEPKPPTCSQFALQIPLFPVRGESWRARIRF